MTEAEWLACTKACLPFPKRRSAKPNGTGLRVLLVEPLDLRIQVSGFPFQFSGAAVWATEPLAPPLTARRTATAIRASAAPHPNAASAPNT